MDLAFFFFNDSAATEIYTLSRHDALPISDVDTVAITVLAVDDAPVNTVPGAQVVNEDTALAVGGISVTDVDGNLSTVQLAVANGTAPVRTPGTSSIRMRAYASKNPNQSGSQADINT